MNCFQRSARQGSFNVDGGRLPSPSKAPVQQRLSQCSSSPSARLRRRSTFSTEVKILEDDYRLDPRPFSRRSGMYMFRATHIRTGEVKAIKIYDVRGADEHRLQRILDEANIVKQVGINRYVVSTHDLYVSPEKHCIVMDLWEGGSLLDELLHRGTMQEIRAGRVLHQLLLGLAHIHAQKVMHRDVKPENIFLKTGKVPPSVLAGGSAGQPLAEEEEMQDLVAIGDFSLATNNIPSCDYVGSPQYSAPELAMIGLHHERSHGGRPYYNEKCDTWSVGIVAFVMLTGLLPFDGESPEMIFMEVIKNNIPFAKAPHMSHGAKDFILALTKSNPSARLSAKEALRHTWLVNMRTS